MWRLWSRLFGWHYAAYRYGIGYKIRRVHRNPEGERYVVIRGEAYFLVDERERRPSPDYVLGLETHIWKPMTWAPSDGAEVPR